MTENGRLVLENGKEILGTQFGHDSSVSGEVVFNTGMVGYPETLTDPSYRGQILVLTYPLIGNYGVPDNTRLNNLLTNFESNKIQVSALVISELSNNKNHWNAVKSLDDWLREFKVPGLYNIDTRALTKKLREQGTMLGKIVNSTDVGLEDPNKRNLVSEASTDEKIVYNEDGKTNVLLVDCGVKNAIIRSLISRDLRVIRVPWEYNFAKEDYDAIVISNGPGDPKTCGKTVENVARAMEDNTPILGICLGNQILALAGGGDTFKLKYGHRSQNQPCVSDGRCYITSQNHGYAVDESSLGADWKVLFQNANDNTNEGIIHKTKPFMSVQFHPEATPGPLDTNFLFDDFLKRVKNVG